MADRRRLRSTVLASGLSLPALNRVCYIRFPNSEGGLWVEGDVWADADLWAWYALPVSVHIYLGSGFWFADADTPIPKDMVTILADAGTNGSTDLVFASLNRGVAVYSEAASASTYNRLATIFRF